MNIFSISLDRLSDKVIEQAAIGIGPEMGKTLKNRAHNLVRELTLSAWTALQSTVPVYEGDLRGAIDYDIEGSGELTFGEVFIVDFLHTSSSPPKPDIPFGARRKLFTTVQLAEFLNDNGINYKTGRPWKRSRDSFSLAPYHGFGKGASIPGTPWVDSAKAQFRIEKRRILNGGN